MSNLTFQDADLATVPTSTVIATDNIGGVNFQRAKISWGTTGSAVDASTSSPFPVQVTSIASSTNTIGNVLGSFSISSSTIVIGAVMPSTQWTVSVTPTTQFTVTTVPSSQATVSVTPTSAFSVSINTSTSVIGAVMPSSQWTASVTPTSQFTVSTIPTSQITASVTPTSAFSVNNNSSTGVIGAVMPSTQWTVSVTPSSQFTVTTTPSSQITASVTPTSAFSVSINTSTSVIGAVMASTTLPVEVANFTYGSPLPAATCSSVLYSSTNNAYDPIFAAITTTSSGATQVASAVASKFIKVLSMQLTAASSVSAMWVSSASTAGFITGNAYLAANAGYVLPFNPLGWFETNSGEALNLILSNSVAVGGSITFITSTSS